MNPPYDKNLHLFILEKSLEMLDSSKGLLINLSPVRWLQDPLAKYKQNVDYKRFGSIRKHTKSIDVITAQSFQKMFGAIGNFDLGIYKVGKREMSNCVDIINPVISRMSEYNYENPAPLEENKYLGIRVRIPLIIAGKSGGRNMENRKLLNTLGKLYVFIDGYKDGKQWWEHYNANQFTKKNVNMGVSIKFNNENEAQNFVDSFNTVIGRFYMGFAITDVHVNNKNVLWMNDYSNLWNDERFCKYFNISSSEWNEIKDIVSQYESG